MINAVGLFLARKLRKAMNGLLYFSLQLPSPFIKKVVVIALLCHFSLLQGQFGLHSFYFWFENTSCCIYRSRGYKFHTYRSEVRLAVQAVFKRIKFQLISKISVEFFLIGFIWNSVLVSVGEEFLFPASNLWERDLILGPSTCYTL